MEHKLLSKSMTIKLIMILATVNQIVVCGTMVLLSMQVGSAYSSKNRAVECSPLRQTYCLVEVKNFNSNRVLV